MKKTHGGRDDPYATLTASPRTSSRRAGLRARNRTPTRSGRLAPLAAQLLPPAKCLPCIHTRITPRASVLKLGRWVENPATNRIPFDAPAVRRADAIMRTRPLDTKSLTDHLRGRQVSHVVVDGAGHLALHFSDGTALIVEANAEGLLARVESPARDASHRPTKRQFDYLRFIAKYMDYFGRAPAESDIQRHFLVSAPSVHNMVVTLERRGFITRQPGEARSIRLCIALGAADWPRSEC